MIAVITTLVFIAILYAGNSGSTDIFKARIQNTDPSSIKFLECEVALSLIIQQDQNLISALMPETYLGGSYPCEYLLSIIDDPSQAESTRLRPRYWWGFKPIYSLLLTRYSLEKTSRIMQISSYFAYLLLGISLIRLGGSVFFILSPFVLIAPFFSGVSVFTDAPIALGYLWAILTNAITHSC